MTQWYEELYKNYATQYDKESFTKGTITEVDFIESEINSNRNIKILDIGCGTGRHSIELAKRGYTVTGIDLSESQLNAARKKALNERLNINFVQADARKSIFNNEFDLAIMLCEGGFSLMETDKMNYQILENASKALELKGKFIFTCLNALYPLFHDLKEFLNTNEQAGTSTQECNFDIMTFRENSTYEVVDDDGNKKLLNCNERFYTPTEIRWYLETLGFNKIDIYGCDIGVFDRNRKLTTNDFEMLVVAEK
ncbi:MAG: class I SAM-dependent methyltransferase [Endomicrobiales bacterium]|nr:class I SAM-dependent methyltransferase [Endomicrobiales bacterium]